MVTPSTLLLTILLAAATAGATPSMQPPPLGLASAPSLRQRQVQKILGEIDVVTAKADVDGMTRLLGEETPVEIIEPDPDAAGGTTTTLLNGKELHTRLVDVYADLRAYHYNRKPVRLTWSPDGATAVAVDLIRESAMMDTTPISSVEERTLTLAWEDGTMRIKRMSVRGISYSPAP